MKTVEINLYKFNELSEEAQQKAVENYEPITGYIYDEAHATVKAFHSVFGTMEGRNSWLYVRISGNMDDNILELKGLRLRTYIINNYPELFKPKYIGSLKSNEIIKHRRIKSKKLSNGNVFNPYYSGCQFETSCVLTGVCYDDSILQPVYDFIKWKNPDYCSYMDFETLMNDCLDALGRDVENEIDYRISFEGIKEEIEANDYDFTENGELY